MRNSKPTAHPFSADRPIESLDGDRLQRRSFALSIAHAIATWQGQDSLVVALYGGWGDGKSSVKWMVVDAMKKDSTTCPLIVQFNPWEWSGQNQLAQVFFDEIGKQVAHQGRTGKHAKAEECGKRIEKLGKYLNLAGSVVTPLGHATNLVLPFASILTDALSKGLKKSGELARQTGEVLQEAMERENSNLQTIRSELNEALVGLKRNVVVMVDDIDRLAADEIRLLFQLIKANSDFPHLVFFLFFQRDVVEQALGRTIQTGTGKEYLEKIVQVPLTLPPIQEIHLEAFVNSKLRELLARRGLEKGFDWSRFSELWKAGLNGYFRNVRDVVRFFSTFEFHAAVFPNPSEFDPVDLFALEVLRVFETDVYKVLATERRLLAIDDLPQFQHEMEGGDVTALWNERIKEIVKVGSASRPSATIAVLHLLFPMESFLISLRTSEHLGKLFKLARVGHPAFYARYFHLCIPQGDIPQAKLVELLGAIGQPRKFRRLLAKFEKQKLALEALTRLLSHSDTFQVANTVCIALALCDVADEFVSSYKDCWWTGYAATSCLLIEVHLNMLTSSDERFELLKVIFERTSGVYLPALLLTRLGSAENEYARKDLPRGVSRDQAKVLTRPQLDELGTLCIKAFERMAASGKLKNHLKLREILLWWTRWIPTSDGPKGYFREMVASDDGLIKILGQFLGGKLENDPNRQFVERMFDPGLSELEQFMPAEQIARRVEEFSKRRMPAASARLCAVFNKIYVEHQQSRADRREPKMSRGFVEEQTVPTPHSHMQVDDVF